MAAILAQVQQLQTVLENDAWKEDDKAQRKVADLISDVIRALPSPVADKVRSRICTHCQFRAASESLYAHPDDDKQKSLGWQDVLDRQQEWINSPKRFFDEPKPLNVVRYLKAWSTKGKYGLLAAIKFRLIAGELHRCRTSWGPRACRFRKALHEAARFRTEAAIEEKDLSEWNAYQKMPTGDRAGESKLFQEARSQAVQEKARQFAQLETALRAYLSKICQQLKSVQNEEEPTFTARTQAEERVTSDQRSVEAPLGTPPSGTGSDHAASLRPAYVADHFASEAICSAPQYTSTNVEMLLSSSQPFAHHAAMDLDDDESQGPSNHHRITCHPSPASSFMHSQPVEG
ncbi:unnamed protein product, partial [Colletotrichum noveboracense]